MRLLQDYRIFQSKSLIPCVIAVLIFVSFTFAYHKYLVHTQNGKDLMLLKLLQNNVKVLLVKDIETALSRHHPNKKFLLFKNFTTNKKGKNAEADTLVNNQALTNAKEETLPFLIDIQTAKKKLWFDLQKFNEIISTTFPSYVTYLIKLNEHNIASWDNGAQKFLLKDTNQVGSDVSLSIKLGIDNQSSYSLNNLNKVYKQTLMCVVVCFVLVISNLYLYFRIRKKILFKMISLEESLMEAEQMKNALVSHNEIEKKLKVSLIKKATQIYLKHELSLHQDTTEELANASLTNYLFPVCLVDPTPEAIDITVLTNWLKDYYAYYFRYVTLKVESFAEKIKINCATEVFYQIIFSLVYNVLRFMEEQSSVHKILTITFVERKMVIKYDSFHLNEEKMIKLSENLYENEIDVFILKCSQVFQSLREHNFNYFIFSENNQNIIEILFGNAIAPQTQIFNIDNYRKK